MAWSDIFQPSGAQTYEEAQANYAAQQQQLQQQTEARLAAGSISPQSAAENQAALGTSLSSTNWAAATGAAAGSVELLYDPAQWWKDTKTGADMAANAAGKGAASILDLLVTAVLRFLSGIPFWFWALLILGAFLWLGGGALLLRKARGALK